MRKHFIKFLSVLLAVASLLSVVVIGNVGAATKAELQNSINQLEQKSNKIEGEIKNLKGQKSEQQQLKAKIEEKIAIVQQQINLCNNEIYKINSKIAENNKEIKKTEKEIEADKLAFKKRLRAIYMSNTGSNVQVLLGAEDFSEFLQLSQLTASVSARDKLLIEKLVAAIEVLNKKQKENNKLLDEQVAVKNLVAQKQQQLQSEGRQIQSLINEISADQSDLESENAKIEKQIKAYERTLASMASAGNTSFTYDGGDFLWPTPGYYNISAGYQSNDAVHRGRHNGVDITGNGRGVIAGARVVAISDGVVVQANGSCGHNYPKNGSCGCGGGYGNYVTINHGTKDGRTYVVTYGHLSSAAVGAGATVKKGQTIGYVGSTGWSTGYHLHFGLAVNGGWVNPMGYFRRVG